MSLDAGLRTKSVQVCKETNTTFVLIQRLAVAFRSPGESNNVNEVGCEFRLAVNVVTPGGYGRINGVLAWMHLAVWTIPPGSVFNCWWFWGAWRLAVRVPCQAVWKLVVPSDTCFPLGDLADVSLSYWILQVWSTRLLVMLQRWDCWVPWVELGIGVQHVAFLELSSEWHPSSWARDGGWTRGTLGLSSGWRVLLVWVCWLWPVRMSPDGLSSSVMSWRVW